MPSDRNGRSDRTGLLWRVAAILADGFAAADEVFGAFRLRRLADDMLRWAGVPANELRRRPSTLP